MPTYVGFSTRDACAIISSDLIKRIEGSVTANPVVWGRKYRVTDEQLVIIDFVNALNIPKGSIPGKPYYGTDFWNYLFEPNVADLQYKIESELRRIAAADNRLEMNTVNLTAAENWIRADVEVAVAPFNIPSMISIRFDRETGRATLT